MKTTEAPPLKIGAVATASGVNVQTIRYYESVRLIVPQRRTEGGFRLYDPAAIRRVRFIKEAQALGFSLDEIRELLALVERPATTCRDVRGRLDRKVETVDAMIHKLERLRAGLVALSKRCPSDTSKTDRCPLLESLGAEVQ